MALLFRRHGWPLSLAMLLIVAFWIVIQVVLPQLLMIDFSFRPNLLPSELGGPKDGYTLGNYRTLWANDVHFAIFVKTIVASAVVTLLTFAVCYPIAFHLAYELKGPKAARLMLVLVIPFWINEILRTFAWYIVLAYAGPLNALLVWLGILDEPMRFLDGNGGVMIGMVYAYLLFMVFPLYNAIESLDPAQVEAARDLGASWGRIHRRVVIPHAKPGIATGCIMVFMLAAGSYAVPALLGSPNSRWFTEIIYNWFFEGGNWNQGAAYAFILLLLCVGFIFAMMRVFRVSLGELTR
ncbi:ABC transporter permease [Zavarzinia compransoris]|uniref:ABC transporter permease n=1 Tax=Zavarzinia compransoris TaxID=1264899 RepID=A0A317EDP3_9PROT|nr:ABC transporter permease [Zavarzinia compransoris]PWR23473.1 ABC transporter permease [Zavarzinia compransoris]TDP45947.1 spermidine/putrescine transport system permease protein [Zavarzinia compransoris]